MLVAHVHQFAWRRPDRGCLRLRCDLGYCQVHAPVRVPDRASHTQEHPHVAREHRHLLHREPRAQRRRPVPRPGAQEPVQRGLSLPRGRRPAMDLGHLEGDRRHRREARGRAARPRSRVRAAGRDRRGHTRRVDLRGPGDHVRRRRHHHGLPLDPRQGRRLHRLGLRVPGGLRRGRVPGGQAPGAPVRAAPPREGRALRRDAGRGLGDRPGRPERSRREAPGREAPGGHRGDRRDRARPAGHARLHLRAPPVSPRACACVTPPGPTRVPRSRPSRSSTSPTSSSCGCRWPTSSARCSSPPSSPAASRPRSTGGWTRSSRTSRS